MDVKTIPEPGLGGNPFRRFLDDLILNVGTFGFEEVFFGAARRATGCEHLTAFAISENGMPRILLAANAGLAPLARLAGEIYVSQFWNADPANDLCRHLEADTEGLLARVTTEELRSSAFRRNCYSATGWTRAGNQMIDRISVFKKLGVETIKVSFHRASKDGPFGVQEVDNIAALMGPLAALVARHGLHSTPGSGNVKQPAYADVLRHVAPLLSEREAQVCAGIIQGKTSEGIALELGISINTVRTHRKRAYSRLRISSQNELMKLILPYMDSNTRSGPRYLEPD